MVSGEMIILPEIPLGRRMPPRSRRTDVVERVLTSDTLAELYRDGANRKQASTQIFTTAKARHDANPNVMHAQFIDARDGMAIHLTQTLHIK